MNRKFGRSKSHRDHLLRNLAASLVLFERIDTTESKAKEIKSIVERLIARAKRGDLESHRRLFGYFFDRNAALKTINELLPRYESRQSGFIKSFKLKNRAGDNSPMMRLELVDSKKFVEPAKIDKTAEKSETADTKKTGSKSTKVKNEVS